MDVRSAHALIRFGLGRATGESVPSDPVGWLKAQLDGSDPALATAWTTTADALVALREDRADRTAGLEPGRNAAQVESDWERQSAVWCNTAAPFRERLVWMWTNHFTVSVRRYEVSGLVFPFIRDAIRPHATGRFQDMLLAVMQHPAMLTYLDNINSYGPDSPVGKRTGRGLNENLARECLDLHTVTPEAGFTQADVVEMARVLTGWSYEVAYTPPRFVFRGTAHSPGEKVVLEQRFPEGLEGGTAALNFLANHPSTYRNLALRLARTFVADDPPPAVIHHLVEVLQNTGGDLKAASLAVVELPEAWVPLSRFRSAMDYVVAVSRSLDLPVRQQLGMRSSMSVLGQPLSSAPFPNGWSDRDADWVGGDAILRRVDWVWALCRQLDRDPIAVAEASLGPLLGARTRLALRLAGSQREALTFLLTSPEFQRR